MPDGRPYEIEYTVRPVSSQITWYSSEIGESDPIAVFYPQESEQKIVIEAKKNGMAQLRGIANGRTSTVSVLVEYNYTFLASPIAFIGPNHLIPGEPPREITYRLNPPNTTIKMTNSSIQEAASKGINVYIGPVNFETSKGIIEISSTKETAYSEGVNLVFEQYDIEGETKTGKIQTVYIDSRLPENDVRLIPVFVRGSGVHSNNWTGGYATESTNGGYIPPAVRDYAYSWGSSRPKGNVLNHGEYLRYLPNHAYSDDKTDVYELIVGDGEHHHILFDKTNPMATVSIGDINNRGYESFESKNIGFEKVTLDGEDAIRIYGGEDFIVYSKAGSYYDFEYLLSSDFSNTGVGKIEYPRYNYDGKEFEVGSTFRQIYDYLENDDEESTGIINYNDQDIILTWANNYTEAKRSGSNRDTYTWTGTKNQNTVQWPSIVSGNFYLGSITGRNIDRFKFVVYKPNTVIEKLTRKNTGYGTQLGDLVVTLNENPIIAIVPNTWLGENYAKDDFPEVYPTIWNPLADTYRTPPGQANAGNIELEYTVFGNKSGEWGSQFKSIGFTAYNTTNGRRFERYHNAGFFQITENHDFWESMFHFMEHNSSDSIYLKNFYKEREYGWYRGSDPMVDKPDVDRNFNGVLNLQNGYSKGYPDTAVRLTVKKYLEGFNRRPAGTSFYVVDIRKFYNYPIGLKIKKTGGEEHQVAIISELEKYGQNPNTQLGGEYYFFPIADTSVSISKTVGNNESRINIEYNTSHGKRYIMIMLVHEIRQSHAMYNPSNSSRHYIKAESWDDVKKVESVEGLDIFNKIYAYDWNNRFYVDSAWLEAEE